MLFHLVNYGVIELACNFVCSALQIQLGGIVKPNDGECHLDTRGEYTHSKLQDYPSISQVNLKVRQNAINVIFAVTSEQIRVYNRLKDNVEGASSGVLSDDSSNVVDLVREQYDVSAVVWCHLIIYLI
jgi:Integrin, beta chain.